MAMRITGLSSGLDIDSIVTDTLKPYKLKIQAQEQQKQILEWKQEQYQSIMKKSTNFYNKYLDILSKDSLSSLKNYNQTKFTSTNESVVTVTGSSSASITNYSVQVEQLATRASGIMSDADLKNKANNESGNEYTTSTTFGGQEIKFQATIGDLDVSLQNFKNSVNSKLTELEDSKVGKSQTEQDSIDKQIETLNKALQETTDDELQQTLGNITIDTDTLLTVSDSKGANASFKLAVNLNGNVNTSKTISNFKENANNNINAKYSSINGGIVFEVKNTGENTLTINGADATATKGQNLKATIFEGSASKSYEQSNNVVNLDGATFAFNGTTNIATNEKINITGSQDVSGLKDKIVSFIKDYNELIGEINGKLWEKYSGDYLPLTDDERDTLSDKQIEKWETKAQAGLLRKDDDLKNLAYNMKNVMSSMIASSGLSLERIGIKPVSDYKELNGTFEIDEDKLTEYLQNNFEDIKEMFTKDISSNSNNSGIIPKLKNLFNDNFIKFDSVFNKKSASSGVFALTNEMTKQITDKKNLINEMNKALNTRQETLYAKYSALETAMAKAQAQQSSMSSWFGTSS